MKWKPACWWFRRDCQHVVRWYLTGRRWQAYSICKICERGRVAFNLPEHITAEWYAERERMRNSENIIEIGSQVQIHGIECSSQNQTPTENEPR